MIGHTLGWIPVGSQPKCVVDSCRGTFGTLQIQPSVSPSCIQPYQPIRFWSGQVLKALHSTVQQLKCWQWRSRSAWTDVCAILCYWWGHKFGYIGMVWSHTQNDLIGTFLQNRIHAVEFFRNTQGWQCWHYCQLCVPTYLQFLSLFASTDVSKCEIRNQGVHKGYILKLNITLNQFIFYGRAKTKLATLAFLYCRDRQTETTQKSNQPLANLRGARDTWPDPLWANISLFSCSFQK